MSVTGGRGFSPEGPGSNPFSVPREQGKHGIPGISPDTFPSRRTSITSSSLFDNSPVNQAHKRRSLQPATNSAPFTSPQPTLSEEADHTQARLEGYSNPTNELNQFSHEYTEHSSQEVAPLAVVRSSDVVQQLPLVNTSEDTEYLRYKELFQAVEKKTLRWKSVLCKPEFLSYQNLGGEHSVVDSSAEWKFDMKYPSATTRIFDSTRRKLEDDEVLVHAKTIDRYGTYTFSVEVNGWTNQSFIDPYNNEHLNTLKILVNKDHWFSRQTKEEVENPFAYDVIVIGHYQPYTSDIDSREGRKNRAIGFTVDNLEGELNISTEIGGKTLKHVPFNDSDPNITEALSIDHAEALLQFMDAIIPLSTLTQLPERRTTQTEDQPSE